MTLVVFAELAACAPRTLEDVFVAVKMNGKSGGPEGAFPDNLDMLWIVHDIWDIL
jgi:hypothetical protein